MSTFFMSFTGLCCFVPEHDITDPNYRQANKMTVLLAETATHMGHGGHGHVPHLPVLVCRHQSVDREGDSRTEDNRRGEWAVFFLDDQDIWLEEGEGDTELEVLYEPGTGEECPTGDEDNARSFGWVAPLDRIAPGSRIKPNCLRDMDVDSSVIARARLMTGQVGALNIARTRQGVMEWEFKEEGGAAEDHRQALADSVFYLTSFSEEKLVLKTKLLRPTMNPQVNRAFPEGVGSVRKIRLLRSPFSTVEAAIRNMPPPYVPIPGPVNSEADSHFGHFYKLSQGHQRMNVPHPHRICRQRTDRKSILSSKLYEFLQNRYHAGSPTCPPALGTKPLQEANEQIEQESVRMERRGEHEPFQAEASSRESGFSFTLGLTGLLAFVPKRSVEAQSNGNQMTVLLADSATPPDLPHGHIAHGSELHLPVLVCPIANILSTDREPDALYRSNTLLDAMPGELMAVFYLDDQELAIEGAEPDSLTIANNQVSTDCTATFRDSFLWVAPLKSISPGAEAIKSGCLQDPGRGPVDPSVVARVRLSEGTIRTWRLAVDGDLNAVLWKFKVPGGPTVLSHRQMIADTVRLDTDFRGAVTLTTRLLRSPSRNGRVNEVFRNPQVPLSIHLQHNQGAVTALIKNMPWPDITGTRTVKPGPPDPDFHLAHIYRLSYSYEQANVPHPVDICPLPNPEHAGSPTCPPVQYRAHPDA